MALAALRTRSAFFLSESAEQGSHTPPLSPPPFLPPSHKISPSTWMFARFLPSLYFMIYIYESGNWCGWTWYANPRYSKIIIPILLPPPPNRLLKECQILCETLWSRTNTARATTTLRLSHRLPHRARQNSNWLWGHSLLFCGVGLFYKEPGNIKHEWWMSLFCFAPSYTPKQKTHLQSIIFFFLTWLSSVSWCMYVRVCVCV